MDARPQRRITRFGLRTLFLLLTVVSLGLAVPKWIHDWRLRQHKPIRQAIVNHHFQGNPQIVRQKNGAYLLRDIFGDERRLTVERIGWVGFRGAEAEGSFDIVQGQGYSGNGMRYLLARTEGIWVVKEAECVSIGCGISGDYSEEIWDQASELIRLSREGDLVTRRKACNTLSRLVQQAQRRGRSKPELPAVLTALKDLEGDPDPEIDRAATRALEMALPSPIKSNKTRGEAMARDR